MIANSDLSESPPFVRRRISREGRSRSRKRPQLHGETTPSETHGRHGSRTGISIQTVKGVTMNWRWKAGAIASGLALLAIASFEIGRIAGEWNSPDYSSETAALE